MATKQPGTFPMRTSNVIGVIGAVLFYAVLGYLGGVFFFGQYGIRQDGTITKILSPNDAKECYTSLEAIKREFAGNAPPVASNSDATNAQKLAQHTKQMIDEAARNLPPLSPPNLFEEAMRKCAENPVLCESKPEDPAKSKSASDHADAPVPEATPFTEYVARCMASPDQCKSDAERAASRKRQVEPKFKPQVKVAKSRDGCAYEPVKVEYDWLYPLHALFARLVAHLWEVSCKDYPQQPSCPSLWRPPVSSGVD